MVPKDLNLPASRFNYEAKNVGEMISIQIHALSFVYQLYITCNNADGVFSYNFFDLMVKKHPLSFTPIKKNIDLKYDFSLNTNGYKYLDVNGRWIFR